MENQCYVAGVNRCGRDPNNVYEGGTVMIDPCGNVMAECPDGAEGSISAETDLDSLKAIRAGFPVLDDADTFRIGE